MTGAHFDSMVRFIAPHSAASAAMMDGMHFLNEVSGRYPNAISLAAGRPAEQYVDSSCVAGFLNEFVQRTGQGQGEQTVWRRMGQYSQTAGIINDLIARYLLVDEEVDIGAGQVIVTNGFQEALIIHLLELSAKGGAVVALDPSYVGLAGAAEVAGAPLFVTSNEKDPVGALIAGAEAALAKGYGDVAVYVIPDFPNPGGVSLSLDDRRRLIAAAAALNLTLIEDTAYRVFWYDRPPPPTLLALDLSGRVRQIGTFSKMFLPGVRVGFSAQRPGAPDAIQRGIAAKSFISVATSPIAQAIVGGFLLSCDFKVREWNAGQRAYYRNNRDRMDSALLETLGRTAGVRWLAPPGGFFFTLDLPFDLDITAADEIAEQHRVLVVPMAMFSPSGRARRQLRLCFSNVAPELIPEAIERLSVYVRRRLAAECSSNSAEGPASRGVRMGDLHV